MESSARTEVGTEARPGRNLAMELVRTTEYAALACARWIGRGDKEGADGAAVDAMRLLLDTVSMDGSVVIGEGEFAAGRLRARALGQASRLGRRSMPERGTHLLDERVRGRGTTLRAGRDSRKKQGSRQQEPLSDSDSRHSHGQSFKSARAGDALVPRT